MRQFYVYELIDSLTGWVFYIGKGSTYGDYDRIEAHRKYALGRAAAPLYKQIREIWSRGGGVVARKIWLTDDEALAYEYEAHLVARYAHCLINIRSGGRIPKGKIRKPIALTSLRTHTQEIVIEAGDLAAGAADYKLTVFLNEQREWCEREARRIGALPRRRACVVRRGNEYAVFVNRVA